MLGEAFYKQFKKDYIIKCSDIDVNDKWLESLVSAIEEDDSYAGVYGRQEPMTFSSLSDKRDLLLVFGLDRKIQIKYIQNSLSHETVHAGYNLNRVWRNNVTDASFCINHVSLPFWRSIASFFTPCFQCDGSVSHTMVVSIFMTLHVAIWHRHVSRSSEWEARRGARHI